MTFPGHDPQHPRFDTRDEAARARSGLYALNQRAAEAATIRAWATGQLRSPATSARPVIMDRPATPYGKGAAGDLGWPFALPWVAPGR
jgi:hypothetical protein